LKPTLKKVTTSNIISQEQFRQLTRPLIGLPISLVWRGYGSAIFFELGELSDKTRFGKNGQEKTSLLGRFGVMIEWSWRVERPQSIYFGSWSSDKIIDYRLNKLTGKVIKAIEVEGRLPELVLELSDGLWVHSFATEEGQPGWCLFLDRQHSPQEWLVSERGKLIKETSLS
jgi:hypothetical protein